MTYFAIGAISDCTKACRLALWASQSLTHALSAQPEDIRDALRIRLELISVGSCILGADLRCVSAWSEGPLRSTQGSEVFGWETDNFDKILITSKSNFDVGLKMWTRFIVHSWNLGFVRRFVCLEYYLLPTCKWEILCLLAYINAGSQLSVHNLCETLSV